jgi:putative cell wall-binding protein
VRLSRIIIGVALVVACGVPAPALGWYADFFEKDASGTAVYEQMAIHPQAVHDPGSQKTFIVYQGQGMNPYAVSYDHAQKRWSSVYEVGTNALSLDSHGAPALVIDPDGYLVVFYGGHNGFLMHARSKRPLSVTGWDDLGAVRAGEWRTAIQATYPQPVIEADGSIRLYYRRDNFLSPTRGDWESVVSTPAPTGGLAWSAPEMLLDGSTFSSQLPTTTGSYWYVNVHHDPGRGPAMAAVRRDFTTSLSDPHVRRGVYYLEWSAEETWTAAGGAWVDPARDFAALETTAVVVTEEPDVFTNQVVLRRDDSGVPGVLYLVRTNIEEPDGEGSADDEGEPATGYAFEWRFSRWNGSSWDESAITGTDNFFDAGTFEFLPDGTIEAFLVTGGEPDDQWFDDPATALDEGQYATRGGDITRWRSTDDGANWDDDGTVIASPGPHARYNNPQIAGGYHAEARIVFSEWNNDSSSFIHKVFLWGQGSFVQRRFTPEFHRLAGATRKGTAIEISKQGFPAGASTVIVASSSDFPDVLCGVPLAQALRAPILLVDTAALSADVAAEIARLNAGSVIILGGERAVSSTVASQLRAMKTSKGVALKVERISGTDRYETSIRIAERLAGLRGVPERAILASGEEFADALAVSPYAARRGYPILLTPRDATRGSIATFLRTAQPGELLVVGGEAAVTDAAIAGYAEALGVEEVPRWAGPNRYATAAVVARHALDAGHTLERFVVATGESYADAVAGGALAARYNTVLLTTPSTSLHAEAERLLRERAFAPGAGVLDVYVLGGPVALHPDVENSLAAVVTELDVLATER